LETCFTTRYHVSISRRKGHNNHASKSNLTSCGGIAYPRLSVWTAYILHRNGINECVAPFLGEIVSTKRIKLGDINIPILQRFFRVQGLDDNLKGITVAFAPSTLGIDPVSWYQGLVFLTDYVAYFEIVIT